MNTAVQNNPNNINQQQAGSTPTTLPAKKRSAEWGVVLLVLSLFLLLELCFRFGGDRLSKDIAHLQSFASIVQTLDDFDPQQGTRILFLGNYLTRYGIDLETITNIAQQEQGIAIQGVKINPDNTAIAEWFYVYRTYLVKAEITPDVIVIGFEGAHLQDAPSRHPDRLAQYYCTWSDYPKLCEYDLKTFEEKTNFAVCKLSAAFGNRDRIPRKVFDIIIPDYQNGISTLNDRRVKTEKNKKPTKPKRPTYKRLAELISIAKQQGTTIILAAMPVPETYEFDPELLTLIKETSATLIDCRTVEGITEEMFFDGLHMDEDAAKLYSSDLTQKAIPLLRTIVDSEMK